MIKQIVRLKKIISISEKEKTLVCLFFMFFQFLYRSNYKGWSVSDGGYIGVRI